MSDRPVALRLKNVCVERQGQPVLADISFSVLAGEFVGIVGPNGAGKTTLLQAILGLVPTRAGTIEVFGVPAARGRRRDPGIGYVPQRQAIATRFPATVEDVVMMGLLHGPARPYHATRRHRQAIRESLERIGIGHLARRPVGRLSGGEQRRVVLAQALCASTKLLVLDEPTFGLDLPSEQEFYALLRALKADRSLSVLAVSHDLVALAGQVDGLICINRRMHIHGRPADVVHSHAIREAYSCEFDFLAGEIAHHEGHGAGD